jgi:ribulose-phosphate 3-epimerase
MMCADFARLGEQIKALEEAGCDRLHWDVMDGHFVPNLTFGALVLESARGLTKLPFDAHLMVTHPARWLDQFIAAGANSIIFHVEAVRDRASMVGEIRKRGAGAGISINPATPVEALESVIRDIDLVLMMSVNPGFAGQKFVRGSVGRVRRMRALIERTGSRAKIQIDGGIRETNIGALWRAGVDCAVLGSGLFVRGKSFRAMIRALRAACR